MAKDYLTKELEKYEKSRKAERLDSNTAVADFDKSENNDSADTEYDNRFETQLVDALVRTSGFMFIIFILIVVVIAAIVFVVLKWHGVSLDFDITDIVERSLDDSFDTDDTTSNIVEISLSESTRTPVDDHISYEGVEPGNQYCITFAAYEVAKVSGDNVDSKLKSSIRKSLLQSQATQSRQVCHIIHQSRLILYSLSTLGIDYQRNKVL
jgi:hypothetical protein